MATHATWPCGQGRCDPSPSRNHHRCLGARCGSEVVWRAGALLCVVCFLVDDNDSTTRWGMNQLGYQLDWQREEVEDGGLLHSFHSLHLVQQNSKGQRKSCFGTPQHLLEKDGQTFQELRRGRFRFAFVWGTHPVVFGCRLVSEVPHKEDCFFRRSSSWVHGRCLVRIGDAHDENSLESEPNWWYFNEGSLCNRNFLMQFV